MAEPVAPGLWLGLNAAPLPGESKLAAFERLAQPTQQWCDASGVGPGGDNSTHHLVPRGPHGERHQECRACGRKERDLRIAGEGFARLAREGRT